MKASDKTKKSNKSLIIRTTDEFNSNLNQLVSKTGLGKSEIVRQLVNENCSVTNTISPEFKRDMSKHIIGILNSANTKLPSEETLDMIKKEAMEICALLNA